MTSSDVAIRQALEQDGFAVVRGAFSSQEIRELRDEAKAVLALDASPVNGGLNSGAVPAESTLACRLLNDPRLAPFYGSARPYKVHVHEDTYNDWHRDAPAQLAARSPASASEFYKIAIYLQDHPIRDGLSVISGSHKDGSGQNPRQHIGICAGDIVVFDMRIRHAGRLPDQSERLIRNVGACLYRFGFLDYPGYQVLLRRLRQYLPLRRPSGGRLALLIAPATSAENAMPYFEQWKRRERNWRLLRPAPWATLEALAHSNSHMMQIAREKLPSFSSWNAKDKRGCSTGADS